ncbi:MucBP domain-containing protein, partial [Lactococcus lactis]|uniref:MucBP domain-containing protein n=1 Tax=Lactococcus lactis TaxID=1358 RepID=UPI00241882C8
MIKRITTLLMTITFISSNVSPSLVIANADGVEIEEQSNTLRSSEEEILEKKQEELQLDDTQSILSNPSGNISLSEPLVSQNARQDIDQNQVKATSNMSNFYIDLPRTGAYNGEGTLSIRPFYFSGSSSMSRLYDLYIVMPLGLTVDGGVDALGTAYNQYLATNPMIISSPIFESLGKTVNGREVYKITTNGSATSPSSNFIDVPIRITDDTSITTIYGNSGTSPDTKDYGVLFAGLVEGTSISNSPPYSHQNVSDTVLAQVGVSNIKVVTIVGNAYVRKMSLFKAQTRDTYVLKEKNTGQILGTKVVQGASGDTYSRVGLVDKFSLWNQLDVTQYDENTYTIQEGEILDGEAVFSPQGTLGGDPNKVYPGHTYELYVNKIGKEVTVKYQDEEGGTIDVDRVLSGYFGEIYTTEQKEIPGYTFKQVQGNATGTFTEEAQEVVYVYERTEAAPVT